MKIAAISDIHGYLPEIPDCDLLLLAGDYSPRVNDELFWLNTVFKPWIKELSERMKIIGVAGNHDFAFEKNKKDLPNLEWTYLEDSAITWKDIKIYGSPHQLVFYDWAFNKEEYQLEKYWSYIHEDTDILLLHGPPQGYGDLTPKFENVGSPSLTKKIEEIKPKLVCFGHIHSGRGTYRLDDSVLANVTLCNEKYKPVHPVMLFELKDGKIEILQK